MRSLVVASLAALALVAGACGGSDGAASSSAAPSTAPARTAAPLPADCAAAAPPERLVPRVAGEVPHDPAAFTEGLVLDDGTLYESTGLEGRSSVRAVDPTTGAVRRRASLPASSFGEGVAIGARGELVQLTWKEGKAFRWAPETLSEVGTFTYDGEGWGLTTLDDGTLVQSDGSDRLTERDPADFSVERSWTVRRDDGPIDQLNELEWDGSHLWANRWQTDEIVRIDRRCRRVDGVVDASALTATARTRSGGRPIDVLNGLAHVPGTDRFLVTGKLWPVMFDVQFVPA